MTNPTLTEPTADAPYGFKADGTPYKRDPAAARASWATRNASGGSPKAPTARRKAAAGKPAPTTEQRAQRTFEFLTIPISGLGIAAQVSGSAPLLADAIVLAHAAPDIAHAVAEVAEQDDRVARGVDQLVQTGPYAALFTALVPVALQLAANHSQRIASVTQMMGTRPVEDIIAGAEAKEETQ
jgi:hypothetical protein